MTNTKQLEVGARARVVPQHWLRGGEVGEIVGFEQRGKNNWLIQFDNKYPGGGIDGDKLWLSQSELSLMTDNDRNVNCRQRASTRTTPMPIDLQ